MASHKHLPVPSDHGAAIAGNDQGMSAAKRHHDACCLTSNDKQIICNCRSLGARLTAANLSPSFSDWFNDVPDAEPAITTEQLLATCRHPHRPEGYGDTVLDGLASLSGEGIFRARPSFKPAAAAPGSGDPAVSLAASTDKSSGHQHINAWSSRPTSSSKQDDHGASLKPSGARSPMTGPPTPQRINAGEPAGQPVPATPAATRNVPGPTSTSTAAVLGSGRTGAECPCPNSRRPVQGALPFPSHGGRSISTRPSMAGASISGQQPQAMDLGHPPVTLAAPEPLEIQQTYPPPGVEPLFIIPWEAADDHIPGQQPRALARDPRKRPGGPSHTVQPPAMPAGGSSPLPAEPQALPLESGHLHASAPTPALAPQLAQHDAAEGPLAACLSAAAVAIQPAVAMLEHEALANLDAADEDDPTRAAAATAAALMEGLQWAVPMAVSFMAMSPERRVKRIIKVSCCYEQGFGQSWGEVKACLALCHLLSGQRVPGGNQHARAPDRTRCVVTEEMFNTAQEMYR